VFAKNLIKAALLLFSIASPGYATLRYVDAGSVETGASWDGVDGNTYQCAVGEGKGYGTIQAAVNVVEPGDTIYMRQGTYICQSAQHAIDSGGIQIPRNRNGQADKWITLRSYPGEWAKIEGCIHYSGAVVRLQYWRFMKFELVGHCSFRTEENIDYRYLYIHDNTFGSVSGDEWHAGGITVPNEDGGGRYISIRYCWISNCQEGIKFFSDYMEENPSGIDINKALSCNEIAYNLVENASDNANSYVLHYKNNQLLSLDPVNTGTDMRYCDRGDKIHHNIFRGVQGCAGIRIGSMDFMQIYNNVFDLVGVSINSNSSTDREPFHVCVYNNLYIGSQFFLNHGCDYESQPGNADNYIISESTKAHPYYYHFNNIHQSPMDAGSLQLFYNWSVYPEDQIDMNLVHTYGNLFYNVDGNSYEYAIRVGSGNYSVNGYVMRGYSQREYASTAQGLHPQDERYVTQETFCPDGQHTMRDGGRGGDHPYLPNIKIPSYVGPCNPDNNAWIDGLESLATLVNGVPVILRDAPESDPVWVEDPSLNPVRVPSAVRGLRVR
jgi:hypothetical protein